MKLRLIVATLALPLLSLFAAPPAASQVSMEFGVRFGPPPPRYEVMCAPPFKHAVWVKELEDGSRAVGVFNLSGRTAAYTLDLNASGFRNDVRVRDLWRHRDLGRYRSRLPLTVASHGVVLLRLRQFPIRVR